MITTNNGFISHIEVDRLNPKKLLYSDNYSVKSGNKNASTTVVGSTSNKWGYVEGVGTEARFRVIKGFIQINKTTLIVADQANNCLRSVDRQTLQTATFAGQCRKSGFQDGVNALFNSPHSVIKSSRSNITLVVTDSFNNAVRVVDMTSRVTTTLISSSSGLSSPTGIAFDYLGENLLISSVFRISKYNMKSHTLTNLTGGLHGGFQNGTLAEARFDHLAELTLLAPGIWLTADEYNKNYRVVNVNQNSVGSICPNLATTLNLPDSLVACYFVNSPMSLLAHDGIAYLGLWGSIWKMTSR